MRAYYNEHDPFAAEWLRNLIAAGLIASGEALAGWTTPQAHDTNGRSATQKDKHGTKHGCACLTLDAQKAVGPARLTASGEMADWLCCRDGKWRPVESGTFPLAHGAPSRVGRLRAYGNAIVAEQAQAFIEAAADALILHELMA